MKFLASILLIYLSAFLLQPVLLQLGCGEGGCKKSYSQASNHSQEKKPVSSPCCPDGTCVTCCCLVCFTGQQSADMFVFIAAKDKTPLCNDNTVIDYSSDCWHPPKGTV